MIAKCPNCSKELAAGVQDCAGCGIVLAKWKPKEAQEARPTLASPADGGIAWKIPALLLLAAGGFFWLHSRGLLPGPLARQDHPFEVTQQDFDARVLHASLPVVVSFSAVSERDKGKDESYRAVQNRYGDKLLYVHVDAASFPQLASTYGITKPTSILFNQGREVKRIDGEAMRQQLIANHQDMKNHDDLVNAFVSELTGFAEVR